VAVVSKSDASGFGRKISKIVVNAPKKEQIAVAFRKTSNFLLYSIKYKSPN
jgi:hypothetical protein